MAKKNEAGNSYTPIKNPELLQGQPDTRPIDQKVADGKSETSLKDNEKWTELAERTKPKEVSQYREKVIRYNIPEKDTTKSEPEKDKE